MTESTADIADELLFCQLTGCYDTDDLMRFEGDGGTRSLLTALLLRQLV